MAETFTWKAETTGTGGGDFTTYASRFGDGYSQEVPKGMNNEVQSWTVVVSGYARDVQAPLDFIRAHRGQSFLWKPPMQSEAILFRCKKYSVNDQGGSYTTLSLTFEQANPL